eukprot:2536909-Ditylum_brightwellii.AAC.1
MTAVRHQLWMKLCSEAGLTDGRCRAMLWQRYPTRCRSKLGSSKGMMLVMTCGKGSNANDGIAIAGNELWPRSICIVGAIALPGRMKQI